MATNKMPANVLGLENEVSEKESALSVEDDQEKCDCLNVVDFPDWERVQRIHRGGLGRLKMENSVLGLCCPKGRPYLREHFRDALGECIPLQSLVALGPLRQNNIYEIVVSSQEVKQRLWSKRELKVNGHVCKLIDPHQREVVCRLFWLPFDIQDEDIATVFQNCGQVVSIVRERSSVSGLRNCMTNVRKLVLRLRNGVDVDAIPDMVTIQWNSALVGVLNRPPWCLRCSARGHIRRFCKAAMCVMCVQFQDSSVPCHGKSFAQALQSGEQLGLQGDTDEEEEGRGKRNEEGWGGLSSWNGGYPGTGSRVRLQVTMRRV